MRVLISLFIAVVLLNVTGYSYTLHGTVYDTNNEKLSYCNIFIQGTTNGTSANVDGK